MAGMVTQTPRNDKGAVDLEMPLPSPVLACFRFGLFVSFLQSPGILLA